jgi:hypothetical protein
MIHIFVRTSYLYKNFTKNIQNKIDKDNVGYCRKERIITTFFLFSFEKSLKIAIEYFETKYTEGGSPKTEMMIS